jgi:hypothetical protein
MPSLTYDELCEFLSTMEMVKPNIFIETGTYEAETTLHMSKYFEHVYTIEINETLFRDARVKCKDIENISCILGDSTKKLSYIVQTIKQPVVFWLDGHWSRGKTSAGDKDVPLLEELEIIEKYFIEEALVIIDDVRLFGGGPYSSKIIDVDWSMITEESILSVLTRCIQFFIHGDRMCIYLRRKEK